MAVAFASLSNGIIVHQTNGEPPYVEGRYEGMAVSAAIPLDRGIRCILLLDPDANTKQKFENLICINRSGAIEWRTPLPTSPDAFVAVEMVNGGIFAWSWSGHKIHLDPNTGKGIGRIFTK